MYELYILWRKSNGFGDFLVLCDWCEETTTVKTLKNVHYMAKMDIFGNFRPKFAIFEFCVICVRK